MNQDSIRLKRNYVRCIENVKLLEIEIAKRDYLQIKTDSLLYYYSDSIKSKNLIIGEQKTKIKRKNKKLIHLGIFNLITLFTLLTIIKK